MDTALPTCFAPLAGELAARARLLESRHERLIRRQIQFAGYCLTQAAAARQDSERCEFPELRAVMLRVALSYERIVAATEELVRRYPPRAGSLERRAPEPPSAQAA